MSKDTIYRQAAIKALNDWFFNSTDDRSPKQVIEALPSAERKKGKWIIDPLRSTTNDIHQVYRHLRCSECDHQEPWPWLTRRNFCPNCGADMREGVQDD